MKYPKSPNSESSCVAYANELFSIHGKVYIPLRRKNQIGSIYAINYTAVEASEVADYLEEFKDI